MEADNIDKIFEFAKKSSLLKDTKRWLATPTMKNKETSAAHSWHLAILAPIVAKELKLDINIERAVLIALVHDIAEALTGDVDFYLIESGQKTAEQKNKEETKAIEKLKDLLPEESGEFIKNIWLEYDKAETEEAKFVKALDKIESVNHMITTGPECYDRPDLIAFYPVNAVKSFPALRPLLEKQHEQLKPGYEQRGWAWKEEYDNF